MEPTEQSSIIDRILTSRQAEAMERLSPAETVLLLLRQLSEKEADVIRRRFGLGRQPLQTLEEIGASYKVTRERIRQIERQTIEKVRALKQFNELLQPMKAAVLQVLNSHGGYLEEQALLETLLQIAGDTEENRQAATFLLGELLTDQVDRIPPTSQLRSGWKLRHASLEDLKSLVDALTNFSTQLGKPLPQEEFLQAFHRTAPRRLKAEPSDEALLATVNLAKDLGHNPFGDYGLTRWGHIHPRRMNDKIYLVLKKHGQPLHFLEITKRINQVGFDDRRAYPPTVHNELILDRAYVLVGRGIYALREWGYRPGVVADVIEHVLRQAGRPLSRPEIVREVLKQRVVKRNTIHLALTNRQRFERNPSGEYRLPDIVSTTDHAPPANRH